MFDRIIRTCRHIRKYKRLSWFVTTVCRIQSDLWQRLIKLNLFTFENRNDSFITLSLYSTDLSLLL